MIGACNTSLFLPRQKRMPQGVVMFCDVIYQIILIKALPLLCEQYANLFLYRFLNVPTAYAHVVVNDNIQQAQDLKIVPRCRFAEEENVICVKTSDRLVALLSSQNVPAFC